MAITMDKGQTDYGKQVKTGRLALVVMASVAFGALIAGGLAMGFERDATSATPIAPATRTAFIPVDDTREVTYYLVNTQEQADLVQWGQDQAAMERAGASVDEPNSSFEIIHVTSPEEGDAALKLISRDMEVSSGLPFNYRIVDLRD